MQRLHSHAFYIYGVIVGLSIREALARVAPHLLHPSTVPAWEARLEAVRLVVLLLMTTVFYFGSGVFFDKVYLNPATCDLYKKKIYGLDFAIGLAHFLFFFGWSLTITDHSRAYFGVSAFLGFMGFILIYDLVWIFMSTGYDTMEEIKLWTFMGVLTFVLSGVAFFVVRAVSDDVVGEYWAILVVMLYLLGDATELFSGRPFYAELLKKLLPKN